MKYAVFWAMAIIGVPLMAVMAQSRKSFMGLLLSALIFSTVIGDMAGINFMSMEHYRGPDRGFEITLTDLIALGLILGMFLKSPGKLKWLPYNTIWMLFFFFLALLSCAISPKPIYAAFSLLKMVRVFLVYWCVVNCLRLRVDLEYVWKGFVGIGLFITFLALKQKYLHGLYRIHGPFDHSNTIPPYSNQFMPMLLLWGVSLKSLSLFKASITVIAALGLVFAVVATQSRAGIALSGFCLVAALFAANVKMPSGRVKAVSVLVFLAILAGGVKAADTIINRIKTAPKSSAEARHEFNYAAEQMAKDNILGIGLNNFSHVLTYNQKYRKHIKVMATEKHAGVAHHIYLLTAAEMGYPGLIVFVIIIFRFMWFFAVMALKNKGFEGILCFGLFLGAIALHASGFLEWVFRVTPATYMFAIASGLGVGLKERLKTS